MALADSLVGLGAFACVIIIIVIIVIFLILWFLFKFIVAFFPSLVVALVVYLITQNWILTLVAFVLTALIFAAVGDRRRGKGPYYR